MSELDRIVSSVAGSTCARDYPSLPDLVRRALVAAGGRSVAIAERNRERHEQRRASVVNAVRVASGALPPDLSPRNRAAIVARRIALKPDIYGVERAPSVRWVREILSEPQINGFASSGTTT